MVIFSKFVYELMFIRDGALPWGIRERGYWDEMMKEICLQALGKEIGECEVNMFEEEAFLFCNFS